jgi:predicted transposase YbfD/YdcC
VAEFGRSKLAWFGSFVALRNGLPAHNTFWRMFRALDPAQFQTGFLNRMRAVSPRLGGQVIALDGKQLRRSQDRGAGQAAIYMVSAWASANRVVLGQRKVADKSNEITAIPELLQGLDLHGCRVAIDAIGCQTAIAHTIVAQGADYLLVLKANQDQLYQDVVDLFANLVISKYRAHAHDHAIMFDKGHGWLERRGAWTISDPKVLAGCAMPRTSPA